MQARERAVVLIGHGGIPSDYPRERVRRWKALHTQRQQSGAEISPEEEALEMELRRHPRTPETDPYKFGFESLAARLASRLGEQPLYVAYNEFCAPSIPEAVMQAVRDRARRITLVSAMMTPGGSHAQVEIPALARELQFAHPTVDIRYAWPFDQDAVAALLHAQVERFDRPSRVTMTRLRTGA
jgi:sirohydrochlorin cobaltochelatase